MRTEKSSKGFNLNKKSRPAVLLSFWQVADLIGYLSLVTGSIKAFLEFKFIRDRISNCLSLRMLHLFFWLVIILNILLLKSLFNRKLCLVITSSYNLNSYKFKRTTFFIHGFWIKDNKCSFKLSENYWKKPTLKEINFPKEQKL